MSLGKERIGYKIALGFLVLFFTLFFWASLISYNPGDPSLSNAVSGPVNNICGIAGAWVSDIALRLFGLFAFLIPVFAIILYLRFLGRIGERSSFGWLLLLGSLFFILSGISISKGIYPYTGCLGGGIGLFIKEFLERYLGAAGYVILTLSLLAVSLFLLGLNFSRIWRFLKKVRVKKTARRRKKKPLKEEPAQEKEGYKLPPISLLKEPSSQGFKVNREELERKAKLIEETLKSFNIEGKVTNIRPGPLVTTFEYQPATGVKISKIVGLQDDLAMALQAVSLRVIAPIPGKSVVGLEVANDTRETVHLREILESQAFRRSKSLLTLALGKDIFGEPYVADLAKMPHLLIAGATGSGKSVSLNAMILSILYKASPKEVKFILIDPKMLELSFYQGIPHLLHPVVVDPKKASNALMWAVEEMERRYTTLSEAGVRDINSYNANSQDKIPYIVIVIDELADLIMVSSKEVEEAITRLAQMARASGIHMIVATQRPSVDVISGLIKANFPTRISFRVSSRADSKTILDGQGAERLLGMGDMLFIPPGETRPVRLHGPFVSEEEIKAVVEYVKSQGEPEYLEEITQSHGMEREGEGDEVDELFQSAVDFAIKMGYVSVSLLQRRFRIGYNRAARIVEEMEKRGIVGPSDGVKPRKVLVKGRIG